MWLSARSVYTTENSSRPSGSTWGSNPGMVSLWCCGDEVRSSLAPAPLRRRPLALRSAPARLAVRRGERTRPPRRLGCIERLAGAAVGLQRLLRAPEHRLGCVALRPEYAEGLAGEQLHA